MNIKIILWENYNNKRRRMIMKKKKKKRMRGGISLSSGWRSIDANYCINYPLPFSLIYEIERQMWQRWYLFMPTFLLSLIMILARQMLARIFCINKIRCMKVVANTEHLLHDISMTYYLIYFTTSKSDGLWDTAPKNVQVSQNSVERKFHQQPPIVQFEH